MRNTHSKFIDKILKEIWSDIDTKMNDGIYTEEFLMSLYNKLSEYVDEESQSSYERLKLHQVKKNLKRVMRKNLIVTKSMI